MKAKQNRLLFKGAWRSSLKQDNVKHTMLSHATKKIQGNLKAAQLFTSEPGSSLHLANQHRLTVVGVAAKLSISSCVTQTFPVV